ncbi:hypothetical protein TanjilG_01714 [Lupinus angustifolius]|uniref:myb-related protein 340-like n=1 Tax=Lupinus angustifolius TaxID=3871 RepID=UPI00090D45F9|nr:PREDICTED: myb-related protein 340-like [Lupinus angustifolius]OIV90633.1 hypothetical protein TanjilG_01714 [Lupinus angustifolius]
MFREVMEGKMGWGIIEEEGWRKGPWIAEEDKLLIQYVEEHGEGRWNSVARIAGLKRNGKSCRLRWVNYLRPDLKRGQITPQEESIIIELHALWGNRWSTIARSLPGRTDNEIKNYWRTHFKKKTKTPSDAAEKAKTRLLKRQQFQQLQQQQQLKQHQLQQQQLQFNLDMKNIMNMFEENVHMVPSTSEETQEILNNIYPNTTPYEEGYFYSMLNGNASAPTSSNEETLWDGLWNFDDVLYNFSAASVPSKASMHNLVAPFC